MILIVGGFAAGKRAWARDNLGYRDSDFSRDPRDGAPVLYDLQDLEQADWEDLLKKEVVICNEVGCGLVPVDPAERERRERTGRLCIELAKRADRVIRVVCGVGTAIKG